MYRAEGAPAPVKNSSKGELVVRMGPEMEAQREWVPMGTRAAWWGEVSQGLSEFLTRMVVVLGTTVTRDCLRRCGSWFFLREMGAKLLFYAEQ
jgi:hypothetical protein